MQLGDKPPSADVAAVGRRATNSAKTPAKFSATFSLVLKPTKCQDTNATAFGLPSY